LEQKRQLLTKPAEQVEEHGRRAAAGGRILEMISHQWSSAVISGHQRHSPAGVRILEMISHQW
jgi:hypothetical protein